MRTFLKSLERFRELVHERGEQLRKLSLEDLKCLTSAPTERLKIGSRPATISIIVRPSPNGGLGVVVQGFLKSRIIGSHVALDGFYKYPDGTVAAMPDQQLREFD